MFDEVSDDQSETFLRLLGRARAGDTHALGRLLNSHRAHLVARIEGKMPMRMRRLLMAEDVVQDAFQAATKGLAGFSPRPHARPEECFQNWLCTIADHRLQDAIRRGIAITRNPEGGIINLPGSGGSSVSPFAEYFAAPGPTPSKVMRGKELQGAVHAALDRLYPPYRQIVELKLLHGMTNQQMAYRLGRNEVAIRKLLSRAIGALREEIGDTSRYLSHA